MQEQLSGVIPEPNKQVQTPTINESLLSIHDRLNDRKSNTAESLDAIITELEQIQARIDADPTAADLASVLQLESLFDEARSQKRNNEHSPQEQTTTATPADDEVVVDDVPDIEVIPFLEEAHGKEKHEELAQEINDIITATNDTLDTDPSYDPRLDGLPARLIEAIADFNIFVDALAGGTDVNQRVLAGKYRRQIVEVANNVVQRINDRIALLSGNEQAADAALFMQTDPNVVSIVRRIDDDQKGLIMHATVEQHIAFLTRLRSEVEALKPGKSAAIQAEIDQLAADVDKLIDAAEAQSLAEITRIADEILADTYAGLADSEKKKLTVEFYLNQHKARATIATHPEQAKKIHLAEKKINPKLVEENAAYKDDVIYERFSKHSLTELLQLWHTQSINPNDNNRLFVELVIEEKLTNMLGEFISVAEKNGKNAESAVELWLSFKDLCESVYGLIWFGIMNNAAVNLTDLTAKHEKITASGDIAGAMRLNGAFNENELVLGHAHFEHDEEQYSDEMGVVQAIVCYAFQKMKEKGGPYDRSGAFFADTTGKLFKEALQATSIRVAGAERPYSIKQRLEGFPPEAVTIIEFTSKLKASRDDMGTLAGLYLMGKYKSAIKYSDGGTGKPDGLIPTLLYQVGKNNARDRALATLLFIDPLDTELATANDEYNENVRQARDEMDNFYNFSTPGWRSSMDVWNEDSRDLISKLLGRPAEELQTRSIVDSIRYRPTRWFGDFPGLDHLFNQTGDRINLPNAYHRAENASLSIIELATDSMGMKLPINQDEMIQQIKAKMRALNTEIANAFAYLGTNPAKDVDPHHPVYPEYPGLNEFAPYHLMLLAATKFYIYSLISAIPVYIPFGEAVINTPALLGRRNIDEYKARFDLAISTVFEMIKDNGTLDGWWKQNLIGVNAVNDPTTSVGGFLSEILPQAFRDEDRLDRTFHTWQLRNLRIYRDLSVKDRADHYTNRPRNPADTRSGWKPNTEASK